MFKFLRSNAKFFYWIIAATFIAFIFVAWGMDVAGSRGNQRRDTTMIGSVNGTEISGHYYQQAVLQLQTNMSQNNPDRTLTANQVAMIRDQAWDEVIREVILREEIERHDLAITDAEVRRIFRESPPPEVLQSFVDENGEPDLQAYRAALSDPQSSNYWARVESWIRESVPQRKLVQLITAGVAVSDNEVHEAYRGQAGRAVVEYMGVSLADLAADFVADEDAINNYYAANPGAFTQAPQGMAKVASWEIEPSQADYDEIRDLALEVKEEIESGITTFEDAVAVYSEDGSAANGGDLGTFDRNRMVAPFTEAAFALPVGQISEPVQTAFGFHLIEVLEQEEEEGEVVRIHARHILMPVSPSDETREAVYTHADEFRQTVTPQDFLSLAGEDSTCTVITPRPFPEGRDIPGLRQSAAGGRFVFRSDAGDISPLLYGDDLVYVVMSDGIVPEGPQPLDRVRGQIEMEIKRDHQLAEARDILSPAVGRVQMGEEMAAVATELELLHAVTDTISSTTNLPDVGYASPLNMVAIEVEPGRLIPEVVTDRGVFAMRVLWQNEFDEAQYAERRPQLRAAILQRKQSQALESWFQARIAEADIQDWRDEVASGM